MGHATACGHPLRDASSATGIESLVVEGFAQEWRGPFRTLPCGAFEPTRDRASVTSQRRAAHRPGTFRWRGRAEFAMLRSVAGQPDIPDGALRRLEPASQTGLDDTDTRDLVLELRRRMRSPTLPLERGDLADQLGLLGMEIESRAESMHNRFSRTRAAAVAGMLAAFVEDGTLDMDGATVLDLGCGSIHPLGPSLVHVLCGARRAVGIDLDPPQDVAAAMRALLRLALSMIAAPSEVAPWARRTPAQVLDSFRGFDPVKMWIGDASGLDGTRLQLCHASVERLPFPDGSVDACASVSFLEHVGDVDAVLAETARVLRPGGVATHSIDGIDHGSYGNAAIGVLDFLREPATSPMVRACNRLRPLEFVARFERAGFDVLAFDVFARHPVDAALRAQFSEPWRSMPQELLEVTQAAVRVRKRADRA